MKMLAKEWVRKYPNSMNAQIVYAQMLLGHGWRIRGVGYANEIEKFAQQAVERSKATEGDGMYARIYWYAL